MKRILLLISVVFALNIFAQKVDYKTNSYTYTIGKSKYLVINLNVVNSSDYKILLWLDNNMNGNQNVKVKLHDYFFKCKGDFSLSNIISEYGSTIENVFTDIYYTFYKIIEPQKAFCITILCKLNNSKAGIKIIEELKHQIVVVSEKDLKNTDIKFYNFNDLKAMSYKEEQITLSSTDILYPKDMKIHKK